MLDAARSRSFTGGLEFDLDPRAYVFLDQGEVYFAECEGDPPIGSRLVAAGALSVSELDAGTLEVAGERHLGRLFDRVPTVERAAVLLALEMIRDETLVWVAAQTCRSAVSRPYARHRSGVHRLCAAAPVIAPQLPAPLPPPRQVDRPIRADSRSVPSESCESSEPFESSELVAEPPTEQVVGHESKNGDGDRFDRFELTWPSGEVEVTDLRVMPPPPPRSAEWADQRHRESFAPSQRTSPRAASGPPLAAPREAPGSGITSPAVVDTAQLRLAVERTTSAIDDFLDTGRRDTTAGFGASVSPGSGAVPPMAPDRGPVAEPDDALSRALAETDAPAPVSASPAVRRGSLSTGPVSQSPPPDSSADRPERRRGARRLVDRLRGR